MSYLPCELHCHTLHSDGDFSVKELQEAAKENHLSLIALTDHNTMSGWDELDDSVVPAIRGIEWTTYFGHMLVWVLVNLLTGVMLYLIILTKK